MSKLEAALMTVPADLAHTLIAHGADQAFCWTGNEPLNLTEFYYELGRKVASQTALAWERELDRVNRND
jgi:pyruvate-formate lyase-activating enzyme